MHTILSRRNVAAILMAVVALCGDQWTAAGVLCDDMGMAASAEETAFVAESQDCRNIAAAVITGKGVVLFVNGDRTADADGIPKVVYGPDSKRLAIIAVHAQQSFVVADGKPSAPYDEVSANSLMFSPDSRHLFYSARLGGVWSAVLDGKATDVGAQMVAQPAFSANGRHLVYVRAMPKGMQLFVDGVPMGSEFDAIRDIVMTPGGDHIAFAAANTSDAWTVVLDGKALGASYAAGVDRICLTADGRHLACVGCNVRGAGDVSQYEVCVDGDRVYGPYCAVTAPPIFSPDGGHIRFGASRLSRRVVQNMRGQVTYPVEPGEYVDGRMVDGSTGSLVQAVYSADGKHLFRQRTVDLLDGGPPGPKYVSLLSLDGIEWGQDARDLTLSPDGLRTASIGTATSGERQVFVDRRAGPIYSEIGPPLFSPDSQHVAYAFRERGKDDWCMALDQTANAGESLVWPTIDRGQDSKWSAATEFKDQTSIDNGHSYNGQIPYHFDPDGTLVYFRIADGHLYRVHWKPDDATTLPATKP